MDYIPGTPPPAGFRLTNADEWEYFSSGASNILFRYTGQHPYFKPFLLRLRRRLSGAPTTRQLYDHLVTRFAPLLGSYLLRTQTIELDPEFAPAVNRRIVEWEEWRNLAGQRASLGRAKRAALVDEDEALALLVQDMSCGNYLYEEVDAGEDDAGERWRDMVTVEFKPKWLTQSPNAPAGWTLCKTCAVRLMNGCLGKKNSGVPEYCPIDLASGDKDRIEQAVYAIVNTPLAVMIADADSDTDYALTLDIVEEHSRSTTILFSLFFSPFLCSSSPFYRQKSYCG
jgi:inositol-pentakisphosphate 2-kinase